VTYQPSAAPASHTCVAKDAVEVACPASPAQPHPQHPVPQLSSQQFTLKAKQHCTLHSQFRIESQDGFPHSLASLYLERANFAELPYLCSIVRRFSRSKGIHNRLLWLGI
jgi:hypothetical protein